MDFRAEYAKKLATPDEAAEKIKTALAESAGTPLIKEK